MRVSLCDYLQRTSRNSQSLANIALTKAITGPNVTYESLFDQVKRISLQFPRKAVISSVLDNSVENAIVFLAVTSSGSAIAPLNPNLLESEYEFFLRKSLGGLVVSEKGTPAEKCAIRLGIPVFHATLSSEGIVSVTGGLAEVLPGGDWQDEALILYTSGTTGTPKCVALTHSNLIASIENIIQTYSLTSRDRTIAIMPLFHIHGLMASLFATLGSGGTVVLPGKFSASNFFTQAKLCTWFTAVPTMLHILLLQSHEESGLPHLRFIRSCSSSLAPSLLEKLEERFKVQVLEAYAMTEAAHQMTSNSLGRRKAGTVGVAQGRVELKIFDSHGKPTKGVGEICVKGPNVISGYKGMANKEDVFYEGFFRTGDQGFLDPDGYLVVTGRLKELINRGGEKISPIEIDSALLSHPNVSEAVAFAIPDEKYGEIVGAAVVMKPGSAKIPMADILDFLQTKLSSFKIPTKIFFATHMPKTDTGKIQRRKVADFFLKPSKL